ncbi:hypothetical protein MN116_005298 [Schistosoma mekongi]|uniref:Uncharacterized protein n=1 Tax=Schistosoma mekongi TaxID=38744 RepID=A0AAE1ZDH8_SCHME|nr:hypothetical protein MN116_005298 [Schistosoma mekongi]
MTENKNLTPTHIQHNNNSNNNNINNTNNHFGNNTTTNYTNSSHPEMLSSMNNKYIELPLIASYSNAFLETIAEETSELETSENGTFNNELFDTDQISFCTDSELKIYEMDFPNQLSSIMIGDNDEHHGNCDVIENLEMYLPKTFNHKSLLNKSLEKSKQHEFPSDNIEKNISNQQPFMEVKSCDYWTLNLPITLGNKTNNSDENELNIKLTNQMNSSLKKTDHMKIVNTATITTTTNTTNTNTINTDNTNDNVQKFSRIHEEFKENQKGIRMSKSPAGFSLPLWNDETTDEELLILSTDYDKNQLCWTLTPSQTRITSSCLPCHRSDETKNIHNYPVMYANATGAAIPNVKVKKVPDTLKRDNFVHVNTVPVMQSTSSSSLQSSRNLLSTFHPLASIHNVCKTSIENPTRTQLPSLCAQSPIKGAEYNLMFPNVSTQTFTKIRPVSNEKAQITPQSDPTVENSKNHMFPSTLIPNRLVINNQPFKSCHQDFNKDTTNQKLLYTGCNSSHFDHTVKPIIPNYTSANMPQVNKQLFTTPHISTYNGGYSIGNNLPKDSIEHKLSSMKGFLNDNSNMLNQQMQQSGLLDRHTTTNTTVSQINNNYPLNQTNMSVSTFKPASRDFSYTLSATHNDFNYSICITPETSIENKCEEKNGIYSKAVDRIQQTFVPTSSFSALCNQDKKFEDEPDSLPHVLLFNEKHNLNSTSTFNNQSTTYHHVKSPDFKTLDYSKLFSSHHHLHSYQRNPVEMDKHEVSECKAPLCNQRSSDNLKIPNDNRNLEANHIKYFFSDEKFTWKPSNQVQQSTYSLEGFKSKLSNDNNISNLFRPLQRSPAVVGVSDLLVKSDAELSRILEKVKNVQQDNCFKLDSQGKLKPTISREDSSPDKDISNGGLHSSSYQDDISPARRRFFPQYLSRDVKLNNSTGLSRQNSDDLEEKRSFYDYGCDDEEDDDKIEDGEVGDDGYLCQSDIQVRNNMFYNDQSVPYSKYIGYNKENNNTSVMQRIRDLELQNQPYRWEDDCKHATNKQSAQIMNINQITNNNNIKTTISSLNEVKIKKVGNGDEFLSSYECEDNDVPYIDSDSLVLEVSHIKNLSPRIADLEEITLSSRRNSVSGSSWLGLYPTDNHTFDQNQSTSELISNKIIIDQSKHGNVQIRRRRRDCHSYDSSTQCRNKRRQNMWLQKLCGCVQASRSH